MNLGQNEKVPIFQNQNKHKIAFFIKIDIDRTYLSKI